MRVGAVFDAIDGKIQFLGYGTLLKESRPPNSITGLSNPKIQLNNGKIVWDTNVGGPIGQIKSYLKCGKSIEIVDIDVKRKKQKNNSKQQTDLQSYFSEKTVCEVDQTKSSVILIGPIRTGKITIAKQLSKDTGLPF